MNRFYFSIDQGTTSNRAIVFDLETGGYRSSSKRVHPIFPVIAAQKSAATVETVDMQHFF